MTFASRTLGSSGDLSGLVQITDTTASNYTLSGVGGTATATYRLASSGIAYAMNAAGNLIAISGEWRILGASADYEARGTWGAGNGSTGGATTWISLSVTADWTLTATNNYATRPLTLEIRQASSGVVLDTATITFEVDSAP